MKTFISILIIFFTTSASADEIARQFASVATGKILNENAPDVKKADRILTSLTNRCIESRQQISDMLAKGQDILRSSGINQPLLPMAEGVSFAAGNRCGGGKVVKVITMYVTTRKNGLSHKDAVEGLHEILARM